MTAKSLDEAIKKAMCVGNGKSFPAIMKMELRDYMAREVMSVLGEKPTESETEILYKYFKRVVGE